jgi:hypothetical protein
MQNIRKEAVLAYFEVLLCIYQKEPTKAAKIMSEQDWQIAYNVRHAGATIRAVQEQPTLHILSMCL